MASKGHKGRPPRPAAIPRTPPWRLFVLAAASVAIALWAVVRHYGHPRRPMVVPAPAPTEIPAPNVIPAGEDATPLPP
jgi:hypothetical protein